MWRIARGWMRSWQPLLELRPSSTQPGPCSQIKEVGHGRPGIHAGGENPVGIVCRWIVSIMRYFNHFTGFSSCLENDVPSHRRFLLTASGGPFPRLLPTRTGDARTGRTLIDLGDGAKDIG